MLTVGAEYDGWLARITRIAQSYDQMTGTSMNKTLAKYRYPVVVIPGLNHASFLASIPPSKVQETDLRAIITIDQAIEMISETVSSFLIVTKEGIDSKKSLESKKKLDHLIDEMTGDMVKPIIDLMNIEGNPYMAEFKGVTPWV